jgi:hypothetical protein
MSDHDLFSWLPADGASRLNGHSTFRTAKVLRLAQAGDAVTGEVVAIERGQIGWANQWLPDGEGRAVVVMRTKAGREDGEDIPVGEWVAIFWTTADLRRAWTQVDGIRVGDDLTVGYLGQTMSGRNTPKHAYAVSVERGDEGTARW